jgi:hypothetical protein
MTVFYKKMILLINELPDHETLKNEGDDSIGCL